MSKDYIYIYIYQQMPSYQQCLSMLLTLILWVWSCIHVFCFNRICIVSIYSINFNDEYSLFLIKDNYPKFVKKQDFFEWRFWITTQLKGFLLLALLSTTFWHTNEQYYKVKYFVCTMYKLWTKDCDNWKECWLFPQMGKLANNFAAWLTPFMHP